MNKCKFAFIIVIILCFHYLDLGAQNSSVVSFPDKNKSQNIDRIEKISINGRVLVWKSTDTAVAKVEDGIITPGSVGTTLIIATGNANVDTCLLTVTPWYSGISNTELEIIFKGLYPRCIKNDTLILQASGEGYLSGALYIWTNGMSSAKLVCNYPAPAGYSSDQEEVLSTPYGLFIQAKRSDVNLPRKIYNASSNFVYNQVVCPEYPPAAGGIPPLSYSLLNGWSYDLQGNVYIGQYMSSDSTHPDYQLKLFKLSNQGQNCSVVYQFPKRSITGYNGGIRHVHACQVDPYSNDIWIATGDYDNQSRIYRNTNRLTPDNSGNAPLELVGIGSQAFRVVSFAFTPNFIYYFMDAPSKPQYMYRMPRMSSYPTMYADIPSTMSYRQTIGLFKDKPFYNNFQYRVDNSTFVILDAVWEDVKQSGETFRELDSVVRVYGLKEFSDGSVQVQEIIGRPAKDRYAHLHPIGRDSRGLFYLAGYNVRGKNLRSTYRAKLTWADVDSTVLNVDSADKNFSIYKLIFNANVTEAGSVRIYKPTYNQPLTDIIPYEQSKSLFWNALKTKAKFTNGKFKISLAQLNKYIQFADKKEISKLVWAMRKYQGGPWELLGGVIAGDYFVSQKGVNRFCDFALITPNNLLAIQPNSVSVKVPIPNNLFNQSFSIHAISDTTLLVDSVCCSEEKFKILSKPALPLMIGLKDTNSYEFSFNVQNTSETSDTLRFFSQNTVVGEVLFSSFSAVNDGRCSSAKDYELSKAFPNPFNGTATINYSIPKDCDVTIKIYSVTGKQVHSEALGKIEKGKHYYSWGPNNAASGVYFFEVSFQNVDANTNKIITKREKVIYLK